MLNKKSDVTAGDVGWPSKPLFFAGIHRFTKLILDTVSIDVATVNKESCVPAYVSKAVHTKT